MSNVFLGATLQLTATVANTTNTAVNWTLTAVSSGTCTGAECGTLSSNGLYTAPGILPQSLSFLLVRATSQADPTKFAEARITLVSDLAVAVTPQSPVVLRNANVQFTAMLTGSGNPNPGILWTVENPQGGCSGCGAIDSNGLYTAPNVVPFETQIVVRARSVADTSKTMATPVLLTSDLVVTVSPPMANLELGASQLFSATVTGTNPTNEVAWGLVPETSTLGNVFDDGTYRAPGILPASPMVTVRARSKLDPNKQSTATVNIQSNFSIAINGPSAVNTGVTQSYTTIFNLPNGGNPFRDVTWSVSCAAGQDCGTITSPTGASFSSFEAPLLQPSPPQVTLRATSVADPSKMATFDVTINNEIGVFLPASLGVGIEKTLQFDAVVAGTQNTAVTWDVNGIVGGNTTVGTITPMGLYTAPDIIPPTGLVAVRATSVADPSKSATTSLRIFSEIAVAVSPFSATRAVNRRQGFSASLTTPSGPPHVTDVTWTVNGIPNGDLTVGQICVAGANPCFAPTGPSSLPVEYLAPATVPAGNPVGLIATSLADTTRRGFAQVNVLPAVQVAVTPNLVTLGLSTGQAPSTQQFGASVLGTANQNVTWSISGAGCAAGACGTVSPTGLYTAPMTAPMPATFSVVATSQDDPAQTGAAMVTIGTGPTITFLNPSSITAGVTFGSEYTLFVIGFNFLSTANGPGSTILVNGVVPLNSVGCPLTTRCEVRFRASDFSTPREIRIQLENPPAVPGDPPIRSNEVSFLVIAPPSTEDVIALLPAAPEATGKDISVVDKTCGTPGAPCFSANVQALGLVVGGNCTAGSGALSFTRPASGMTQTEICVQGTGFDVNSTYSISGPSPNDISISNVRTFGVGVALTLTISANTAPGPRTLLVSNLQRERSAAVGAIEVK